MIHVGFDRYRAVLPGYLRTLVVPIALLFSLVGAAETPSDRSGSVAEWRERTSVARDWLHGNYVEAWQKQVRYDGAPIALRFAAHNPATGSVVSEVFLPAFDVLRRMSNDKLLVDATWGGKTHSLSQGWAALGAGKTDMTACYASLESEERGFQLLTLLDLPELFPSAAVATMVSERLYAKYFKADFARNGVQIARMKATGPSVFFLREAPSQPTNLAGMKIFSAAGVQADAVRSLGGTPVVMETPLIRSAIMDRTLDAAAITEAAAAVYGINKEARHLLLADIGRTNFEYCLSPAFYERLPSDLKVVLNAWLRAQGQAESQIFYGLNGALAREQFVAAGGAVRVLTEAELRRWREHLTEVEEKEVARLEQKGLPARQFMRDVRELIQHYASYTENQIMMDTIEHPILGMND